MKKELYVDRIEDGDIVVLLDGEKNIYEIELGFFAAPPNEGDYFDFVFEDGKPVSAEFLAKKTEEAHERIRYLMAKMRKAADRR